MNSGLAFIRLLRPINLVIIAFTMYAMRWGVLYALTRGYRVPGEFQLSEFDFFLTVLVMVLLAGAGNMINDYFDLKVDRVNKPDRVIVGRTVKRRVVMLGHHGLNILATVIAGWVSFRQGQPWLIFVPIIMAALLWFYSLLFKRRLWVGNFVVATLVAVVPIWAGVFEIPLLEQTLIRIGGNGKAFNFEAWRWMIGYAGFAFWTTLIREIQKDIEDQKGDQQAGFKTLPIVWGRKGARNYLNLLFAVLFVAIGITIFEVSKQLSDATMQTVFAAMAVIGIGLPAGCSWYITLAARTRADYGRASTWSKLTMAGGLLIGALMPFWHY